MASWPHVATSRPGTVSPTAPPSRPIWRTSTQCWTCTWTSTCRGAAGQLPSRRTVRVPSPRSPELGAARVTSDSVEDVVLVGQLVGAPVQSAGAADEGRLVGVDHAATQRDEPAFGEVHGLRVGQPPQQRDGLLPPARRADLPHLHTNRLAQ